MSIINVRTQILAILNTIKTAAGIHTIHYDYPTEVVGTPAVAVHFEGGGEEYNSTQKNNMIIKFIVRAIVSKTDSSDYDQAQTTVLLTLVDAILNEARLNKYAHLSGYSHSFLPATYEGINVGQVGNQNIFFVDILFEAEDLVAVI